MKRLAAIKGKTWQEGDLWFSATDELPIASFGRTPEECTSRVMSALNAYMEACVKGNELLVMLQHYELIVEQEAEGYTFCLETPVGERADDLVLT